MATTTDSINGYNARETQLLASVLICSKTDITIDYKKFAEVNGFTTEASARAGWSKLKKKVEAVGGVKLPTGDSGGTPKSIKGKKRKNAEVDADKDDEQMKEEDAASTPAKKPAAKKGRGKKIKEEVEDSDTMGMPEDPVFDDVNFDN